MQGWRDWHATRVSGRVHAADHRRPRQLRHIAVDGFNLPVSIKPSRADCPAPKCAKDLNAGCPAELKNKNGEGCLSQCQVDALAGHADNNPNCCSGSHDTPATCPKSGVKHYDYFKNGCRDAYAYAYDEASESALWTCDSKKGGKSDYTVEFCPS